MPTLNHAARETLQLAGLTSRQWAQRHGYASAAEWRGDECGCPDDRCIGYHHDAEEECGCLPALINELRRDERKLADARPVWARALGLRLPPTGASDRLLPEAAAAAQITSIPTLMAFREGVLVFSQAGALPAPALAELIEKVKGLDMDEIHRSVAAQQA